MPYGKYFIDGFDFLFTLEGGASDAEEILMNKKKYTYWQEEGHWLGYFEEFPDYRTQGETLEELQENLKDIYRELVSGNIPSVRRVAELVVA